MSEHGLLTDEHGPGPCIAVLRSVDYEVLRAKDEFEEGTEDEVLLEFAAETDRVVFTCDKRFTIVDGERVTDHSGIVYADQTMLQRRPEDAASAVDRIAITVLAEDRRGSEFYVSDWA